MHLPPHPSLSLLLTALPLLPPNSAADTPIIEFLIEGLPQERKATSLSQD